MVCGCIKEKSFYISLKSHNVEVKLCNLYQQVENILPIYHVPSFHNKPHLVDVLFARTRTSFGIGQTVYFSVVNRNVSIKQILLTCFILFPISCLQTEESSHSIL